MGGPIYMRLNRRKIRLLVAIGLGLLLIGIGWEPVTRRLREGCHEMYLQFALRFPIERELGFLFASPRIELEDSLFSTEVITFAWVNKDGILWKAGVRDGDILLDNRYMGRICSDWNAARGQSVTFRVVPFGNGPRLVDRDIRTITFVMPQK